MMKRIMLALVAMMAGAGITLGEASVNSESFRGANGQATQDPRLATHPDRITDGAVVSMPVVRRGVGLVDIFA